MAWFLITQTVQTVKKPRRVFAAHGENTSRVVSVELARRRTENNLFCQRSSSSFFDKRNYAMET